MELFKVADLKLRLEEVKDFLKDEKNRMAVILGGTLVLSVLYLFLFILPGFGELSGASREASDLRKKIDLVNSRLQRLDSMKAKLAMMKKEQGSYSKQLPNEKEIPELLKELAATAKRSNVRLLSIKPFPLTPVEGDGKGKVYFGDMPVLISAKSGFHQLGHFVDAIEEGRRFITVEDLQISYDSKTPRASNIQTILKTYVAVEDEQGEKKK